MPRTPKPRPAVAPTIPAPPATPPEAAPLPAPVCPAPTVDDTGHPANATHEHHPRDDAPQPTEGSPAEGTGARVDAGPESPGATPEGDPGQPAASPASPGTNTSHSAFSHPAEAWDAMGAMRKGVTFGQTRAIGALLLATYNPRVMAPEMMDRLMASIREFGFCEPVVIRPEDNLVAGGHQRVEALSRVLAGQGYSREAIQAAHIPVAVLPTGVSDAGMKALNVGLNKISGEWSFVRLNEVLTDVMKASTEGLVDFTLSGFVPADLDDLTKQLSAIHYTPGTYGPTAGAKGHGAFGGGGGGGSGSSTGMGGGLDPATDSAAVLSAYLSGGTPAEDSGGVSTAGGASDSTSGNPAGAAHAGADTLDALRDCGYDHATVAAVLGAATSRNGAGGLVAVEYPPDAVHLAEHTRDCLGVLARALGCTHAEALYGATLAFLASHGIEAPPVPFPMPRATLLSALPAGAPDGTPEGLDTPSTLPAADPA